MTAATKPEGHRWARALCVLAALVAFVVAANLLSDWLNGLLQLELGPRTEPTLHRLLMAATAAYTVLIAIPFVPGIEIGLSLLMLFGAKVAPLMYACTLIGLGLAYFAGYALPSAALQKLLGELGLRRASAFLGRIEAMTTAERLDFLVSHSPRRLVPHLLRYRYLAVALALNLPGNAMIGGGGGIAFLAGASRLFSPPAFLATLAVAIAPVPLAVLIFGEGILL